MAHDPTRAPSSVFQLPVEKLRAGYYSDTYFNRTRDLVAKHLHDRVVKIQVFQKNRAVLGGIDEAVAILRECSGRYRAPDEVRYWKERESDKVRYWKTGWDKLTVRALYEGDDVDPLEPVLTIEGPYRLFAHLETVYLGVLARRTLVGTNVRKVCEAARGKPVMFFPARHDHWTVQTGDGYAAHHAGAIGVSTDAQASWWGGQGMGTVPHAMIAAFGGSTVDAAVAFAREYGKETDVSVLVDFDNDCARTSVAVADALHHCHLPLWGVRLDTSGTLVDAGLIREGLGQYKPTGVCPELVRLVRRELDDHGYPEVKIVVSGGFTPDKVTTFEEARVPVDSYGVGSSLLRGENDFTADIVRVDGKPCSKVGREEIPSERLELVN